MKKPIIGITPLWDTKLNSIWMLPQYMEQVENAGGIPIILPLTCDKKIIGRLVCECDGFLFTGGSDVSPCYYGEQQSELCGELCCIRDEMEETLFRNAVLELDKPVFGICRGLQFINVLLGGSLYQDLNEQFHGKTESFSHYRPPEQGMVEHDVEIYKNTLLSDLLGEEKITVNSYHHQGIKNLAERLKSAAVSDDGLIEAAYMPEQRFAVAVQWHPELMGDNDKAQTLFRAFVTAGQK